MTELIFYWALFFYALSLRYFGARLAGTSFLLIGLLMFVLGTANQNEVFHNIASRHFLGRLPNVFHMQWAPHFLLGVMISRYAFHDWCNRRLKLILLVAAVLAMLQLGLYAAHDDFQSGFVVVVLYAIVVGSGFALMFPGRHQYSLRCLRLDRNWGSRLGNLSYPVYINQYAIALALLSVLSVYDIRLQNLHLIFRIGAFILFNLIIIFTAAVLIRLTDSMTDGLRDHFRGASL